MVSDNTSQRTNNVKLRDFKEALKYLSEEEIRALQKQIRLEKQSRSREKGIVFPCYIPKKNSPYLPVVLTWLYDKGYISKKTPYKLANFAILQLIRKVLEEIRGKTTEPQQL